MTQQGQTEHNAQSGQAVAKQTGSKLSAAFWEDKILRPFYTRNGQRFEVAEWHARIQHAGQRRHVGLGTNNRQEAARVAVRVFRAIVSKGWDAALAELKPEKAAAPRGVVTVGDWLGVVRPLLDVRDGTFEGYAYALRKIATEAMPGQGAKSNKRFNPKQTVWRQEADRVFLDKLAPEKVEAWRVAFVAKAGPKDADRKRAKRSVNSFLRNARALFSPKLIRKAEKIGATIPKPVPFAGVELEENTGSTRYVSCINAAVLARTAAAELKDADPEAYKVFLLALGAGLRRGEIDALQWQHVDADKGVVRVVSTEDHELKTDSSEGQVYVDAGMLAELKALKDDEASLFVVDAKKASGTKTRGAQYYRCNDTFDRLTAWLRTQGVLTQKPLHALRKEFGSIITEHADIHTASRQLRHSTIGTTAAYYADQRRRVAPAIGDMLAGKAVAK